MRCDYANAPAGSILSLLPAAQEAAAACAMTKTAADFLEIQDRKDICRSAKKTTWYDHRRKIKHIRYSSKERCPLQAAVIAAGGTMPPPEQIVSRAVYTVGMAAAALDMSKTAIRRLVKSGEIQGITDRAGYLIPGSELLRFTSKCAVIGNTRRGAIRPQE